MRNKFIAWLLPATALAANGAFAQTVYNNQGSDTGGYLINGATETGNGDDVTNTDFELLNLAAPAGPNYFNNVNLDLFNGNGVAVTTNAIMGVWDDTGPGGGPGGEMFTINSNFTIGADSVADLGFDGLFTTFGLRQSVPADDEVWMSITFTDNGGTDTDTTAAELNNLSPAVGGTPTVGSTDQLDYFAFSTGDIDTDDTFYGDDPTVMHWDTGLNFGANITTVPVPPPSTPGPAALLGFVAPAFVALRRRSRQS